MISTVVVFANDVRDELGRTCLCILSRTGVEEYVTNILASRASASVAEAPGYIPSVPDTSQHIPSQG
jgi:hypothetical protein